MDKRLDKIRYRPFHNRWYQCPELVNLVISRAKIPAPLRYAVCLIYNNAEKVLHSFGITDPLAKGGVLEAHFR